MRLKIYNSLKILARSFCESNRQDVSNSKLHYLSQVLNRGKNQFFDDYLRYKFLRNIPSEEKLRSIIEQYNELGVTIDDISRYPWFLSIEDPHMKILQECRKQHENIADHLPKWFLSIFFDLAELRFRRMVYEFVCGDQTMREAFRRDKENRLEIFAENLEESRESLVPLLHQHGILFFMNFERILDRIAFLKNDIGLSSDAIKDDLYLLRFSPQIMSSRFAIMKAEKMNLSRSYYLRCAQEIFDQKLKSNREKLSRLKGYATIGHYFAATTDHDVSFITRLIESYPRIKTLAPDLLKERIDLILESGYTYDEIIGCPKILTFSQDTIIERLKLIGRSKWKIHRLCSSNKDFDDYLIKMQKLKLRKI